MVRPGHVDRVANEASPALCGDVVPTGQSSPRMDGPDGCADDARGASASADPGEREAREARMVSPGQPGPVANDALPASGSADLAEQVASVATRPEGNLTGQYSGAASGDGHNV